MSTRVQCPRTIFILDVSGSMTGIKSETLQLSTKRYIEDIAQNSYVGIVLFNNKAWVEHKVVKITDRTVRDSLSAKVPKMSSGQTDIGSGLLMALSSLTSENLSTEGANFILVTDGEDTTGSNYVDRIMHLILNAKVKITCIAMGNKADPNLERLASETNGNTYIASDSNREMAIRVIESAFIEAKANKELNEALTISVCNDLIAINSHLTNKKVVIDSDIGRNTNFTIGSENINKFSVHFTSPNGHIYDSTSKEFTKNETYKRYQLSLRNAEPGVWSINFERYSSDKLSATVSVTSQPLNPNAVQMRVWLKEADIASQMPPMIFCELRKGTDVVIGAEVMATIERPNGTQTEIKLNNHNNLYCNYFIDFCGEGRYNVSVLAKNGSNNCQIQSSGTSKPLTETLSAYQSYINWFTNPLQKIYNAIVQNVQQFERQRIVGCIKVTDNTPSTSLSTEKLEEMLLSESLKSLSMASNRLQSTVESPAPRNAKTPMARVRTSIAKKNEQQLDEIKVAKEGLRELLLIVKKMVTFSKLSDDEKKPLKKVVEEVDAFIYSTKTATIADVENNRIKLEDIKMRVSNK